MSNKNEQGVDLGLRQVIKDLGGIAGGAALLASVPWLSSCTPEKLQEIKGQKVTAKRNIVRCVKPNGDEPRRCKTKRKKGAK